MTVYRRRKGVVKARRLTATENVQIDRTTTISAAAGQWVVDDDGQIEVMDDSDFQAMYESTPAPKPTGSIITPSGV